MPTFVCNVLSPSKDVSVSFSDLDSAFKNVVEELMKEAGMDEKTAVELIDRVKIVYVNANYPGNFNLWEVDNDEGELVRMYINKED